MQPARKELHYFQRGVAEETGAGSESGGDGGANGGEAGEDVEGGEHEGGAG